MSHQDYQLLNKKISEILRQRRKATGVTQKELAKKSGRSQAYISKFENGQIGLDVGDFIKISNALDTDPHAVLDELMLLVEKS